jgi:glycosyltransferase involved in cell wall biosynthesis
MAKVGTLSGRVLANSTGTAHRCEAALPLGRAKSGTTDHVCTSAGPGVEARESRLAVVAPGGRQNPSARVRALQWVDRLTEPTDAYTYLDTPDVRASTLLPRARHLPAAERGLRRLATAPSATNLLLQREATPLSSGALEQRLLQRHSHSAYDLDDALWTARGLLSPRRLLQSHRKAAALASTADVVVAGSAVVADWANAIASRVVRIPSCVELADYPVKANYGIDGRPTLLWVGSFSTERYLHALTPALTALAQHLPLRVLLVGAAGGRLPKALAPLVERRRWSEAAVHTALTESDVGLMPLPDDPFTRGKCAYKLLQYSAAALPVVGTPVGASADFLISAGAPRPTTLEAWEDELHTLLTTDAGTRRRLGLAARAAVSAQYTYDVWQQEWCDAVLPG